MEACVTTGNARVDRGKTTTSAGLLRKGNEEERERESREVTTTPTYSM